MHQLLSRRHFLQTTALATAASAFPLTAKSASANGKLRTAHIGVGGMGMSDLRSIMSHPMVEVAALCDVDSKFLETAAALHPHAKTYRDFREMLSEFGDRIDAVVVSTPDHTHAPAAMSALNLLKPVYCQKPLTHDIFEARQLRSTAEARGLVTQMGIQIHSHQEYRRAKAMIQAGVIGKVKQIYAWCNKSWGYDGGPLEKFQAPPETLEWNLWTGTAAERPYVPGMYHPAQWRRLIDFGTGTLGDMGVHIFDTPYSALELTAPTWVKVECRAPTGIGHPTQMTVHYEFPGTKYTTEKVKWTWMDGDAAPPTSEAVGLPEEMKLPGSASLFVGEEGFLLLPHIAAPQLFPEEKFKDYRKSDVPGGNHYHEWVDACLGKTETGAPFTYGGPLTEALLLGVIGSRYPEKTLEWNAEKLAITNHSEADEFLKRKYRAGFEVAGL